MIQEPWSDGQVLSHFGWETAALLGEGGEARVYAIGADRVLRLVRPEGEADADAQRKRADLLDRISAGNTAAAFRTPTVLDLCEVGGRVAVIEERLPGVPMAEALRSAEGEARSRLIRCYLEAARSIGDIKIHEPFWGDLGASGGVRCGSYKAYLSEKLQSVRRVAADLASLVMTTPESLPDCSAPSLVHFDIFPANVLVDEGCVTAVIDFGWSSMMADRRLDCWSAVAYLDEEISPMATDGDRLLATEWLKEQGLDLAYGVAKRWIASYWCFAHDDPVMRAWCSRVLSA